MIYFFCYVVKEIQNSHMRMRCTENIFDCLLILDCRVRPDLRLTSVMGYCLKFDYRICSFFSLFCDNYAWYIRVQANATAKVGCFKPVFH